MTCLRIFLFQSKCMLFCLRFTISASINAVLTVCQTEYMRKLLFTGGDASGILTLDKTNDRLRQCGMEFSVAFTFTDNINGDMRIDKAEDVIIQIDRCTDLDNIFLSALSGYCVFNDRDLTIKLTQLQVGIQLHCTSSRDMIDNDTVMNTADYHGSSSFIMHSQKEASKSTPYV